MKVPTLTLTLTLTVTRTLTLITIPIPIPILTPTFNCKKQHAQAKKSSDSLRVAAAHSARRAKWAQYLGKGNGAADKVASPPSYDCVWSVDNQVGFTGHTFSNDFSTLTTYFYNAKGELLRTYEQEKGYKAGEM